jgi:hypothetical protein
MSFIIKKNTNFLFGSAGVKDGLDKLGYIATLCTVCTVKGDKEGEDTFVDLHVTRRQLVALKDAIEKALIEY